MVARRPILVVEDDDELRACLEDELREAGYVALGARDAATALAIVDRQRPFVVIVDLAMAGGGGWETLRRMREWPDWDRIARIAVSELRRTDRGGLGGIPIFVKPFRFADILHAIRQHERPTPEV